MPKRYGKHKTNQMQIKKNLTPNDKQELENFSIFLKDSKNMSPKDLLEKHGTYMGFSEEELENIKLNNK